VARIRTIKPEFCSSADVGAISRDARLFFLQVLTEADDEGRLLWIPRRLCGVLYPFDTDVTAEMLERWCLECVHRGMLVHYRLGDVQYLQIANWSKHQKISHAAKSKLPSYSDQGVTVLDGKAPESLQKSSGESPESLRPDLGTGNREGEQGTGNRESSLRSDSSPADAGDASAEVEKPEAAKPELKLVPAAAVAERREARLRAVTEDAVGAYNAVLGKPNGLLPAVNWPVGAKTRMKQIKRCTETASAICQRVFGSKHITREFWDSYFGQCAEDPHKSGRIGGGKDHANWAPDFAYLTREDVMASVFDKAMAA
jgi:hypothetical protein